MYDGETAAAGVEGVAVDVAVADAGVDGAFVGLAAATPTNSAPKIIEATTTNETTAFR